MLTLEMDKKRMNGRLVEMMFCEDNGKLRRLNASSAVRYESTDWKVRNEEEGTKKQLFMKLARLVEASGNDERNEGSEQEKKELGKKRRNGIKGRQK